MTPEQFAELVEYFRKNNSWSDDGFYMNTCERHRPCFKYIEARYDSRDNKFWNIEFYGSAINYEAESKGFRVENEDDIRKIYKFLDTPHFSQRGGERT